MVPLFFSIVFPTSVGKLDVTVVVLALESVTKEKERRLR